jgi:hypothetical protein
MLIEHDHGGGSVGTVLSSWEGRDGSLRVSGTIDSPRAVRAVEKGEMRELSLGTSVTSTSDGNVLMRSNDEISLCSRAARPGCRITELAGKTVASTHTFSKKGESSAR